MQPSDTPVVYVAGTTTEDEYVMVVHGAGLPGWVVIGLTTLLEVYPTGVGVGLTVDGQAVMMAGFVGTCEAQRPMR